MEVIVALDAGTSSIRAVIFDMEGTILKISSSTYSPQYEENMKVRQSTETWERGLYTILKESASFLNSNSYHPLCISLTSQRASVIPVDRNGITLYPALMWQDKTTSKQCEQIVARIGIEEVYHRTGVRIDSYFSAPKMMWLAQNASDAYKKCIKLLGVQDYIAYLLTGVYVTDFTQASRTLLFNISNNSWDDQIIAELDLDQSLLPDVVAPGSMIGSTTKSIESLTNFPAQIPVILAGGDQSTAAVGMGVINPGSVGTNTGTGSFIMTPVDKPIFDRKLRISCSASAIPNRWNIEASVLTTGRLYHWLALEIGSGNFSRTQIDDENILKKELKALDELASQSITGSHGVVAIPHFAGAATPFWNQHARGIFLNLDLSTTRADIIRSVLESIAVELGMGFEILKENVGNLKVMIIAGGMTKAKIFNQIQADSFGIPVRKNHRTEATSFGAFITALVYSGIHKDHSEAYKVLTIDDVSEWEYPNMENVRILDTIKHFRSQFDRVLVENEIYSALRELRYAE